MARHGRIVIRQPLLLAIENTSLTGSVALVCPGLCLAEATLASRKTHSRRLLAAIDRLLRDSGTDLASVDAIAVSLGPGSFTGLRIGLATAKALALAAAKPLVGVPTLKALALQLASQPLPIRVVQDARKEEVFTALFLPDGQGGIVRREEDRAARPETVAAGIREPTILVGDGAVLYRDIFRQRCPGLARFAPPELHHPRAAAVGFEGLARLAANPSPLPTDCAPIYVRPSDAEQHLARQKLR